MKSSCRYYLLILLTCFRAGFSQSNFWIKTNGPPGVDVTALEIAKNGHIYAGTYDHGLFRSTDGGNNWVAIDSGVIRHRINTIAFNSNGHIFIGTQGGGIFRSTNNGKNWFQANTGLKHGIVHSLFVYPNGHLLAATENFIGFYAGGVYRSIDNGDTWTQLFNTGSGVFSLFVNSIGDIFIGVAQSGVYRSTDNGATWSRINEYWYPLSIISDPSGLIFASSQSSIFRSDDNGNTWVKTGLNQDRFILCLRTNAQGHIFAGTVGLGVFRSIDHGITWMRIGLNDSIIRAFAINSGDTIWAGASYSGIYFSNDNGVTWSPKNRGLTGAQVISLASGPQGYLFAGRSGVLGQEVGSGGGIFRSTDRGANWIQKGFTQLNTFSIAINANGSIFYSSTAVYRSKDWGESWTNVLDGYALSLAISLNGEIFVASQWSDGFRMQGGIFRSSDDGANWTRVGLESPFSLPHLVGVNSKSHLFVAASNSLFRSINGGSSWMRLQIDAANPFVNAILIKPHDKIFIGTNKGVYYSTDNGDTWTAVNEGFLNTSVKSFTVNRRGHIFAGTHGGGVFRSLNDAGEWQPLNAGLANLNVNSLSCDSLGYIYAGTDNGVFRSADITTSLAFSKNELPRSYVLEQNFPNPFNLSTTIQFRVPVSNFVTLKVFNIQGEEVATVVSENLPAGAFAKSWNAAQIANGIYFYRLKAGDFVQTRKLIVLKL